MTLYNVIDPAFLHRFAPAASRFWAGLDGTCSRYEVNSPARVAAFLAQWAEETKGFTRFHEIFDYTPQALLAEFPTHVTAEQAAALGRQEGESFVPPERQALIADLVYANRDGNGDADSHDGSAFRGRGWAMLTFRDNYTAYSKACADTAVVLNPIVLEDDLHAVGSAGWFWSTHGLNALADKGDFEGITKVINGGLNGYAARCQYWATAKAIWMAP